MANDMKIIQIDKAVETEYEAAKILRQHPKDTVILNNVVGYDIPIVSGI